MDQFGLLAQPVKIKILQLETHNNNQIELERVSLKISPWG